MDGGARAFVYRLCVYVRTPERGTACQRRKHLLITSEYVQFPAALKVYAA